MKKTNKKIAILLLIIILLNHFLILKVNAVTITPNYFDLSAIDSKFQYRLNPNKNEFIEEVVCNSTYSNISYNTDIETDDQKDMIKIKNLNTANNNNTTYTFNNSENNKLYIKFNNAILGPNNEKYNVYLYIDKIEILNIKSSTLLLSIYTKSYFGFGVRQATMDNTTIKFETRIVVLDSDDKGISNKIPGVLKIEDIDNEEKVKFTNLSNNFDDISNISSHVYKGNSNNEGNIPPTPEDQIKNKIITNYENQTIEFIDSEGINKNGDDGAIYLLCDDIRNIQSVLTNYSTRRC